MKKRNVVLVLAFIATAICAWAIASIVFEKKELPQPGNSSGLLDSYQDSTDKVLEIMASQKIHEEKK